MEETGNTNPAAAAEEAINAIRKLLEAVGNDEALKKKLEAALSALTGKTDDAGEKTSSADEPETAEEDDDTGDEEKEEDGGITPGPDLSDIFNEDALAGMVVGFVAGAAVVGGGVLLHKLIAND